MTRTTPLARLATALAFLTRIPVRRADRSPESIGRSAAAFPAVGALLGVSSVGVLWLVRGMPATLGAGLIVLTGVLLTGALHLDGLADTADGFGGGRTSEDVLRIMRDHQIGTYGAVALIFAVTLQVTAIASLIDRGIAARVVVVAPTAGRWAMVVVGRWLPYARRESGLGCVLTDYVRTRELVEATVLAVVIVSAVAGWRGAADLVISTALAIGFGLMCRRRIGGITGDTLGATAVLCETTVLVAAVALPSVAWRP